MLEHEWPPSLNFSPILYFPKNGYWSDVMHDMTNITVKVSSHFALCVAARTVWNTPWGKIKSSAGIIHCPTMKMFLPQICVLLCTSICWIHSSKDRLVLALEIQWHVNFYSQYFYFEGNIFWGVVTPFNWHNITFSICLYKYNKCYHNCEFHVSSVFLFT